MTTAIHHAVAAKAAKFGIHLDITAEGDIVAFYDDRLLASGRKAKTVLDDAIKAFEAETQGEDWPDGGDEIGRKGQASQASDPVEAEESDADTSKSVIKRKYRAIYKPFQNTCGDDLANQLKQFLTVKTEDGEKVDLEGLEAFARANGVWVPTYAHLNAGMQRMNVRNRLAAKIRKGHVTAWTK